MESGKRDGIKNRKRRLIRRRWRRRRKAASVILLGVLIIGLAIFLGHKCLELMGKTVMTSQKGKNIVAEEKKYVEVKLSMVGDILTHTQVMAVSYTHLCGKLCCMIKLCSVIRRKMTGK